MSCGSDFLDLGVSKYRGTPKSSIFNRIFQYFHHPVLKIDYLEEGGGRVVCFFFTVKSTPLWGSLRRTGLMIRAWLNHWFPLIRPNIKTLFLYGRVGGPG